MWRKYVIITAIVALAVALVAVGCATPTPEGTPAPDGTGTEPPVAASIEIPFLSDWQGSGHNKADSEPFTHWNEDTPAEIPVECAKCHSAPGFQDFVGADGSAAGAVDKAAPIGTTINCVTCHNPQANALTSVVMPSGAEIANLGPSARCMQCHQGRASSQTVADAVGTGDPDTVNAELGFINIHYFAAAGTLFGSEAHAGYEYADKAYPTRNSHVPGYTECINCHNQHTLEIKVEQCQQCHGDAALEDFRMNGSLADYDGDGDVKEGIKGEIDGLRDTLMTAMQGYATDKLETPFVYNEAAYPYFFNDTNADGEAGEDESVRDNGFKGWTPRLLEAAYNYQVSLKDPGAFAHNAKYIIALLYDSIENVNEGSPTPVDLSKAHRNDPGHFDGTAEAFRHWDEDGKVPASCSKCHASNGMAQLLTEGGNISNPLPNGLACANCHDTSQDFPALYQPKDATFPSGAVLTFGETAPSNLCITCHQGRESTVSVNKVLTGKPDDTVDEKISFRNIHYFAAGATLFGNDAQGAYQYKDAQYVGRNMHVNGFQECKNCHDVHALNVKTDACASCHNSADPDTYRMDPTDWNGNADTTEGVKAEINVFRDRLFAAIQKYATDRAGKAIGYNTLAYPYFFYDTNGDGQIDASEAKSDNGYKSWTPRLLKAAYNYQYSIKDPGAFTHNPKYVMQIMYDSIKDLGGDVTGLTRPEAAK